MAVVYMLSFCFLAMPFSFFLVFFLPFPLVLAQAAQRQDQAAQRLAQNDSGLAEAGYGYLAAGSSHPEAHSNHFKDGWIEGQTDRWTEFPLCVL